MLSSPQEDGGIIFFALVGGGFTVENLGEGKAIWEACCFLVLEEGSSEA